MSTSSLPWLYEQAKQQRHKGYLKALRFTGVEVHEGNFNRGDKYCYKKGRYCPFREEKQTDVSIALEIAKDAIETCE